MKIGFKVPPSGCLYIVSGGRSWNTDSVDQCGESERGFAIRGQPPSLRPRVLGFLAIFPFLPRAKCRAVLYQR